jgi:hypothetical protein
LQLYKKVVWNLSWNEIAHPANHKRVSFHNLKS